MRPNGRRRRSYGRRRRSGGLGGLVKMVAVVAVLIAAVVLIIRFANGGGVRGDVYLDGVTVNGVNLGGYTYEDGAAKIRQMAQEHLSQTIQLKYNGQTVKEITPATDLNATMDVERPLTLAWNFGHTGDRAQRQQQMEYVKNNPQRYNSELSYDEALLDQIIAEIKTAIDVASTEPTVKLDVELQQVKIKPGADGLELDAAELKQQIVAAIVEGASAEIQLQPKVKQPSITADELVANSDKIVEFETSTKGSASDRTHNIRLALEAFNGRVLYPGESYSFNNIVGKRTEELGYRPAIEYAGNSTKMGIGGGVCQASTTLYNALIRAGVTIEQRYPHTMTVGYIDPSCDAAVDERRKDLVFTNNTIYNMYIFTSVDGARAQVMVFGHRPEYRMELKSKKITEIEPKMKKEKDLTGQYAYYTDETVLKSEGKPGLRSEGYLVYYDWESGEEVRREKLHTDTYAAMNTVFWVGIHDPEEELF